ncbi:hypothetical protein SAMN05216267_102144 [Actinacidiphila rubida]|uniref:SIS domain-containing protein n=1 Tax=Actinacidiphila rubida TaxID=310780 RepID=A0A1H8N785_9ACTN|nr:hypothetical protein [Actinacidiphila rubida]SEO25339.1 hypothetical protein SAMN05216267_102144 [Actinacidiphila rubida]
MDALRVALLREALAGTEWPRATRAFGGALRRAVRRRGGGLLLVGTDAYEPWHLAAHLDEEAAWSGVPELAPTLVRHRVPPGARPHLSVGLGRLAAAGRKDTLLVVAPGPLGDTFLERLADVRRDGATLLAVDASGTPDLHGLAHDALPVPEDPLVPLDTVQHLVAAGAAAARRPGPRARRARLADRLMAPPRRW